VHISHAGNVNQKIRKKIAEIIAPNFKRTTRAITVKFNTILVLLQMTAKVQKHSGKRIQTMVDTFVKEKLFLGVRELSDEIIEELSQSLFSGTDEIKANERTTTSHSTPHSSTTWTTADTSDLDYHASTKTVPDAEFVEFEGYTIPRMDWKESIKQYMEIDIVMKKNTITTQVAPSEDTEADDEDADSQENPDKTEISTEDVQFSKQMKHILELMDFNKNEEQVLKACGWTGLDDLLLNAPQEQAKLFRMGLSNEKIRWIMTYVNYVFNQVMENGELGEVMKLTKEKWEAIMRRNYHIALEATKKTRYPAPNNFEPSFEHVTAYMNRISVTLPPLVLFFWMGDDLFAAKDDDSSAGREWCPFVQLDVNNRCPEIDDNFTTLRDGFFNEGGAMDFNEEYVVFPYQRKYVDNPKANNYGSVTAMITKETPIEGHPNADSFATGVDIASDFFEFVVGKTYDAVYPDAFKGYEKDTIKNVKSYHIFARGNIHLARKYKNFGTVQDIRDLHNDLCNHLLIGIPEHFFLLDNDEHELMPEDNQEEPTIFHNLKKDEAFNDLMRRTLLLFKAAFSADIALLDGSHRCVALKSSVLNMEIHTTRSEKFQSIYSLNDATNFELSKVCGMAPISIVWPTWNQFTSPDCNWMVSTYFRQRTVESDFRIAYPKIV
jgi:hypothetical protein